MSELEDNLLDQMRAAGIPEPVREFRFSPLRRWRFDFAWPELMIAVEVHGGQWSHGRHLRGKSAANEAEKYNAAVMLGWGVFTFWTDQIHNGYAIETMSTVLPKNPVK